jgi:adenosylhomocysteine/aminodeoxyfutalosine nucleosidase
MRIAIMGAMKEEIEPLLLHFNNIEKVEYANNIFYIAKYNDLELVVAYSKIGKVFAAITAMILIEKFKCEKLLFSGVAGGINKNLKIGDLIVADTLCQHDVDIVAFGHPYGFIPESKIYIETDKIFVEIAKKVANEKNINLKIGTIATGDQFIASEDKKLWIEKTYKADALEMEGASVAVVCSNMNIPFFVLRAISDTANMEAGFDFDAFLKKSAKNSADFLIKMLDNIK